MEPDDAAITSSADEVYARPDITQAAAERVMADATATDEERAGAAVVLGRTAYYGNRISEAISYLEPVLTSAALDPARRDEARLILAPALSKVGRTDEALALLGGLEHGSDPFAEAQALNQRGAILVEQGRFDQALHAFSEAAKRHEAQDDLAAAGRALLNMGAAASEMGDHGAAEEHYRRAWKLNLDAGQVVMCAMIEGNLGYVASRKGDFAAALAWYERGRASFASLGDVSLLTAVLEVDHATTLLDLGLHREAKIAADYARQSSVHGSNQSLLIQSEILLGEALLGLGHITEAERALRSSSTAAETIGLRAWQLRAELLLLRIKSAAPTDHQHVDGGEFRRVAEGLVDAQWHRDALRTIILGAQYLIHLGHRDEALELARWAATLDPAKTESLDQHLLTAICASLLEDSDELADAIDDGLNELNRLRHLLGSAELRSRLGRRAQDFRDLALDGPLRLGDAQQTLDFVHRTKLTPSIATSHHEVATYRAQLRDLRVREQESMLAGRPDHTVRQEQEQIEAALADLLDSEAQPSGQDSLAGPGIQIRFLTHRDVLIAIVASPILRLVRLGNASEIDRAARAQRSALRKLALSNDQRHVERLRAASERIEQLVLDPLEVHDADLLRIEPNRSTAGISWAGLPSLRDRRFLLTSGWTSQSPTPIEVASVGAIDGGSLEFGEAEVVAISERWVEHARQSESVVGCGVDEARRVLSQHDLVHIAAHGQFRSDNPFLSSIEFEGGSLSVLELEGVELPGLAILASCDGGAASQVGSELAGTTAALLAQGVRAAVAPDIVVDDQSSLRFSIDLHDELIRGAPIAEAVRNSRQRAHDRSTPADQAAAAAFHAYARDAGALQPLNISRI